MAPTILPRARIGSLSSSDDGGGGPPRLPCMILESVLLDVRPGREDEFLAAFAEARPLITVQQGLRSLELRRCLDEGRGSRFLLQVAWDTLADHTEGFRRSAEYERWRALLHPFYDPFPEVEHYGEALLTA